MRYVFRADATLNMGAGHVMRLVAIAEEVISSGSQAVFIGNISEVDWVVERISNVGFTEILTEGDDFIPNSKSDILILDSYEIDPLADFISIERWLSVILVADNMTPAYKANLIIHPGLDSFWHGRSNAPVLAGPRFIPIRKSLRRSGLLRVTDSLQTQIMVLSGGTDPHKLTDALETALKEIDIDFKVTFLTKADHKHIKDERFSYIPFGKDYEDYLYSADLVFSTASTSCFEALALERPLGLVCAVPNQEHNFRFLTNLGVARSIGQRSDARGWMLKRGEILKLIVSGELRTSLSKKSKGLIDLSGSARIIEAINQYSCK